VSDALTDAPEWLFKLRDALREAGFVQVEEQRYDEPFGNYLATFARRNMRVRPVKDRGEWRIDLWDETRPVTVHGFPDYTSPRMLVAVESGVGDHGLIPPPEPDDESRWLLLNTDKAEEMLSDEASWRVIHGYRSQYMKETYGLDPPAR
jgi:hypothetical protein